MFGLDATPEALTHILDDIGAGAGVDILPLGLRCGADARAAVIVTIGGVRHGLTVNDTRLLALLVQDDDARHDAGPIAVALKAAAIAAEQTVEVETLIIPREGEPAWSGAGWPSPHRFGPVLPRRAA